MVKWIGIIGAVVGLTCVIGYAFNGSRRAVTIPADLQAAIAAIPPVRALPPDAAVQGATWDERISATARGKPQHREALEAFSDASAQVMSNSPQPLSQDITEVLRNGWTSATVDLVEYMADAQPHLDRPALAVGPEPFPLPPIPDGIPALPKLLQVQNLFRLLACRAHQIAVDDPARALDLALRICRLSISFCADDLPLNYHMFGIAGLTISSGLLQRLVREPQIGPDEILAAERQLAEIDAKWGGTPAGIRGEAQRLLRFVRQGLSNQSTLAPNERKVLRQVVQGLDFQAFENESDPLFRALIAYYSRPANQRPHDLPPGLDSPILHAGFPGLHRFSVQADVARANLRLLRMEALQRVDPTTTSVSLLTDPFSGQPLRESPQATWSIGPDRKDDHAAMAYDPTNGMASAGDVLQKRP